MMIRKSNVMVVGAVMLGALSLGGCATKKFVNQEVGRVEAQSLAANQTQDTQLAELDKTSREALERADAAGKLAEGKFVYSVVLSDDSMKFPVSKATLSPEAQARLDAFLDKLKTDNRNVYVEVQGHTDSTGSAEGNERLAAERAESVRRYLNKHGIALNRVATISYGEDEPIAPNNSREGRSANRRVVLVVLS